MACCCSNTCVKYLLIFFNVICVLGSIAVIIISSMIQWKLYYYHLFSSINLSVATVVLLASASLLVLISVLACSGAILERRWMLNTSAGLAFCASAAQLAGGGFALGLALSSSDLHAALEAGMREMQVLYLRPGDEGALARQAWDATQRDLRCCGRSSYLEWLAVGLAAPPPSCQCDVTSPQCDQDAGVFVAGCYGTLVWFLYDMEAIVAILAFVFAGFEILVCMVFALVLGCLLNRNRQKPLNVL